MNYGKTARIQDIAISAGYMFWYPCMQSTGNIEDHSGLNNDGTKTVSDAVLWANEGWASWRTQAVADESVAVPASAFDFDFQNGESLLFSFWMNKDANVRYHMPFHNANANGEKGFKMQAISAAIDGKYLLGFYSGGTSFVTSAASVVLSDNADHHVVIALDAVAETADMYIDGVLDSVIQGVDISAWKTQGTPAGTKSDDPLLIGGPSNSTSECQKRDIHALKRTGGLPSDIQQIVNKLHSRLFFPLSVTEWS